jgi:hypothetical protein
MINDELVLNETRWVYHAIDQSNNYKIITGYDLTSALFSFTTYQIEFGLLP